MSKQSRLLVISRDFFSWIISAVLLFIFINYSSLSAHAADPVITLQGSNPTTVFLNTTYVDAGATALDSANDSVPVTIDTSSVDTSTVGTYTVNFTAGTVTATRTVRVTVLLTPILSLLLDEDEEIDPNADNTPPVVTIIGSSPVLVLKDHPYTDAGATAFDNVDGSRLVSNNAHLVDTSIITTYNVHYSAQDTSGNTGHADRTVQVVADEEPPIIITDAFTIEAGSIYTDAPIQTSDNSNGVVTLTRNSFINTATVGTTSVSYTATDPSGNSIDKDIDVIVVDTTNPQLVIAGANPVTIEAGDIYADAGAVTSDNSNGNVAIEIIGDVINTSTVTPLNNPHQVSYTATDTSGNSNIPTIRAVHVADTTPPEIILIERDPIDVVVNSTNTTFVDPGAETSDNSDSNITLTVKVDGIVGNSIDISSAGTHTITYTAVDTSNNISEKSRTINVIQQDITPPEITLNGSSTVQVVKNSTYSDAGTTAVDAVDGVVTNITCQVNGVVIDCNNGLDTSTLGFFSIEFTTIDSAGNTSTAITRSIEIVEADTLAPMIFPNGENPITVEQTTSEQGTVYTDPGATAFDVVDGDIAVTINTSGVSTTTANPTGINNFVTFEATDTAGNTFQRTRTVIVEAVPDLGVIKGQWHLNEGTATTANDASGNNNHLTVSNITETDWVTGKSGTAIDFTEADDQQASIGNATTALQPASVTLSAWVFVNPDSPSTRDWEWIAAQGDNYGIYIFPDKRELVFYKREAARDDWVGVDSADNAINFNQWHHVVGTFDATTHTMTLYLDGVEVKKKSINSNDDNFEGIGYDKGNGFTIGSMQGGRLFNGIIDEVTVYDKAIPDQDISFLMSRTAVDTLAPVITLIGRESLNVVAGMDYVDAGATVTDDTNNNLSASNDANLIVDTSTPGSYPVTFRATDNAGNTGKAIRTVQVIAEDTTAPVITLNGPDPVIVALNSNYSDLGATAVDDVDGDLNVTVNSSFVHTSIADTYAVTFTAEDAAGNIGTATRAVKVLVNPPVDETVFVGTYDGSDKPVGGRRGSIVFSDYSDTNDPGSIASWLTQSSGNILTVNSDLGFTAALQAAQPGDRIQLESGIYRMQPISISGTENNPITIESVPGQWAIFDGSKNGSTFQIEVNNTSWLNFRNFEIRNGTGGSINIEQSHHHLYEGLKIHNNARGFDFTNGSSYSLIRYNESYHNFTPSDHGQNGDGFGVWSEGSNNDPIGEGVILEHNIAWGNADDGIDMYKNEAQVTLRNNIVRNNGFNVLDDPSFVGNGNGYKLGPQGENDVIPGESGHYVIGNIADNNRGEGFDRNGSTAIQYLRGNVATNNGGENYEEEFYQNGFGGGNTPVLFLDSASKDNCTAEGVYPSEVNPGQNGAAPPPSHCLSQ